jgi:hypothetical protein
VDVEELEVVVVEVSEVVVVEEVDQHQELQLTKDQFKLSPAKNRPSVTTAIEFFRILIFFKTSFT